MPYTIQRIVLRHCHVQPRWVMQYSTGWTDPEEVPIFLVEIADDRNSGFGEFLPTSVLYASARERSAGTDSHLDEWQTLRSTCEGLIGKDARMLRSLIPSHLEKREASSIVDSIDFALHDLVGRNAGLPVWALLGGVRQPWVQGMPVVHTDSVPAMVERAWEYHRMGGYRLFKLKPIGRAEQDREVMIKLREKLGDDIRFFVDPNYSLENGAAGVVDYVLQLADLGLDTIEDPIDCDWPTYKWIQDRVPVRLMIDDKARTPQAVLEIFAARCARAINIHANWASGFAPAIQKSTLAAMGGLDTIIGSTYYLGFGVAAYQTLSSVIPSRHICEQVNISDDLKRIGVKKEYQTRDGRIHISCEPGLGVEPDWSAIDDMTQRKESIE